MNSPIKKVSCRIATKLNYFPTLTPQTHKRSIGDKRSQSKRGSSSLPIKNLNHKDDNSRRDDRIRLFSEPSRPREWDREAPGEKRRKRRKPAVAMGSSFPIVAFLAFLFYSPPTTASRFTFPQIDELVISDPDRRRVVCGDRSFEEQPRIRGSHATEHLPYDLEIYGRSSVTRPFQSGPTAGTVCNHCLFSEVKGTATLAEQP